MDTVSSPDPISRQLAEIGLEPARRGDREWSVGVPCTSRGTTTVLIEAHERTLRMRAFIMRAPDRDHLGVYRRLLGKNLHTTHWRFAIDADGDVHLRADIPLAGLATDGLDGLLGALSALVDETYEGLVRMGFEVPEGTRFGRPPPG